MIEKLTAYIIMVNIYMRKITIDRVKLPMDINWKNIGISLSGGADSALLAYLVCSNLHENCKVHISTQIRCWQTRPWQEHVSLAVFDWLVARFPNLEFHRHTNFVPPELEWGSKGPTIDINGVLKSGDRIILKSFNEYLAHKIKLDAWFAGVTQNPNVSMEHALSDRNEPAIDEIVTHMGITVCHPFIKTRKDWIMKQYIQHELGELLNITRSCEGDNIDYPEVFKGLDYKTYTPGQFVPTCGKCFWCQEREWGLINAMQQ
jgi:hypothetical protein